MNLKELKESLYKLLYMFGDLSLSQVIKEIDHLLDKLDYFDMKSRYKRKAFA